MTNFYEELKLDKNASAADIAAELVRLESVWHKREMSRPELAAEKLALIVQAKKIFATDASKAQYDRELTAPPKESKPDDPDAARKAQFQKWYGDAVRYSDAGQADLAKTAIERAMSYGINDDDSEFHYRAAQIYRRNGDMSTALGHINRAIVNDSEAPEYYLEKAFILESLQNDAYRNNAENAPALLRQQREALRDAANKAAARSDNDARGRAYGMMAFSLYYSRQKDETQAEKFAREALRLGDQWGNAQRVLDDMAEEHAAAEQAEQDARARFDEAERQSRERKKQMEEADRQRSERQNAMAEKDKKAKMLYLLGWAGIILSVLLLFLHTSSSFGIALKTIVVFGSSALLNYADAFRSGYPSRKITAVTSFLGVVYCFTAATSAYTIMGYSASSASRTWKLMLIMLVVFFVLIFAAKAIGKKKDQNTRF